MFTAVFHQNFLNFSKISIFLLLMLYLSILILTILMVFIIILAIQLKILNLLINFSQLEGIL